VDIKNISRIRLASQQLESTKLKTPKELVGWMGAMQAQDYAMSKWAIGTRLPGTTEDKVETSLDKGDILRTHILRPTWHLVSAKNIYWMLELTAPQVKALAKARHKELELNEIVFSKSHTIIEKALRDKNHLTREELAAVLERAKINASNERGTHLMLQAELDGLVCSGSTKNNKQTYALLSERATKPKSITREEAAAKLARIYFTSHCPATIQDFIWWSGLPVREAKTALEAIRREFIEEKIDGESYWLSNSFTLPKQNLFYLLPAFDEFIISYKNRTAVLSTEYQKKAFTLNGIFKPTIVLNGQGIGTWKRTIKKDTVLMETDFFFPPTKAVLPLLAKATEDYGIFLNKKTILKTI